MAELMSDRIRFYYLSSYLNYVIYWNSNFPLFIGVYLKVSVYAKFIQIRKFEKNSSIRENYLTFYVLMVEILAFLAYSK